MYSELAVVIITTQFVLLIMEVHFQPHRSIRLTPAVTSDIRQGAVFTSLPVYRVGLNLYVLKDSKSKNFSVIITFYK